ncbi:MAG TPA: ATP-binding protein, partial [Steroidobacteraceae bacterium]|nr:ATP-binding protein [Steroidobacteraceae bacterium]
DERIREVVDSASVLFYIDVHIRNHGVIFQSSNLRGHMLPDVKGLHVFNATVPGIGELRISEFFLAPFDVMIATPLGPVNAVMEGYMEVCAALIGIMLVVSAAIGFGLSRLALRPVRLIQETANRIGSDNLSERIPVAQVNDEVSKLARLLNQMFDRLESSFNQIRRFAAEASHELRTPLSLMRLQAEKLVMEGGLTPAQEEAVQGQLEEIGRLNKIIGELLFLSRAEAQAIVLDRKLKDPAEFMSNFAQDARVLVEHQGLRFSCSHAGEGSAAFDSKWLPQVLLNLLTNAIKASPPGGLITLRSAISRRAWRVSVEDEGPGVAPELRDRIFERFFRLSSATGAEPSGSGLGLTICRSIIQLHRGCIFAESGEGGRGLRVVFELPAEYAPAAPAVESRLLESAGA